MPCAKRDEQSTNDFAIISIDASLSAIVTAMPALAPAKAMTAYGATHKDSNCDGGLVTMVHYPTANLASARHLATSVQHRRDIREMPRALLILI